MIASQKAGQRTMPSSIAPSLLFAVAVIVLATGSMHSARVIGTASAQLARTVMCDRSTPADVRLGAERDEDNAFGPMRAIASRGALDRVVWDARLMAMIGAGDLPPPAMASA